MIQARKLASVIGNYSTAERDTGFTWIDGKHIYKKTISFGALPNTDEKTVSLGTTVDGVIKIEAIGKINNSSNTIFPIPFTSTGNIVSQISITITEFNKISIRTGSDRSNATAIVTIYYTKS